MEHYHVILSKTDRYILESYHDIAEYMADFWGEGCEVVIHNLERLDNSVMKIVNGYHSSRCPHI